MPKNHKVRAKIEEDLARRWAGYRGEAALDFHLSKLPENEYMIFHGIRLTNGKYFFQIDTLILSAKFAIILEVKNFSGTLFFDPQFNQMIQTTLNGEERGYPHPIEQANLQAEELKKWLSKRGINLPVEFFIVISKPSTILRTPPRNSQINQKIIHSQYLISKIDKVSMSYKEKQLDIKALKKVSKIILKEHTLESLDILKFYKISMDEILTGVLCPVCIAKPMERRGGNWLCKACRLLSSSAHFKTVADLFLLNNGVPISNKHFREFLHLSSPHISRRILESLNLPQTGTGKGRRYLPPPNYKDIADLDIQQY
jgi:hypothetical protein